jgi:hypothetical protein
MYVAISLGLGAYFLWMGIVLVTKPECIKRDPLWRLRFAWSRRAEEVYMILARPIGVIVIVAGILLLAEGVLGLLGLQ